ncbi:uncharacterized protein LOC112564007 [Pomacea canaliculata]|uniref:uncharacterized protein LOC112564007 n=1 Tax=Pomacea canaliculata TaxID=400727 RepID=UPI000D73C2DA|nr:uncharacterized protein LOC112564007 [Pomacea canaliculata]XP_025094313.1 uncharacterized protein LOC112564007 [Pomacea canaliculata]XP_025094322.1 uncharacterized protein LOC112564007 [Pomacea canaliculata]XP_025094333.1 uncharacterized protein LOC112564007 [Pomacea canaliculata]XP_025094341.1 uncharacterized protein LOC112564007 [Pomacea canaliculata]
MAGHVTAQHPEVSSGRRQQVQVNRRLVRFKFRHCIFKLGVIGVLVAVFFIVFGLCGPGWASHYYLWTDELYQSNKASVAAVRVLYCVTITGIILSLALEAYQDFCKVPPPAENKAVEIVSFIAGLSGIVGTVIFSLLFPGNENLGWAFGLSATSSTLTTVSSLLIAGSRVFHKDSLTSAIADSTVAGTSAADDGHLAPPGIPLQNFQATAYPERYLSEFPHSSSATSSRSADAVETSSDVHAQYVQPADGAPPFYVMGGHVVPPSAPPFTGDSGRDPLGSFTPVVPSAPPLEDVLY